MKRILSLILCALLLLSLLPAGVMAAPTDPGIILAEAYALEIGEVLPYSVSLAGRITEIYASYDPMYKNISVILEVPGYEDMPVLCYRIKGDCAEYLCVGENIVVTGTLSNYNGTIEFQAGSKVEYDNGQLDSCPVFCLSPEEWSQCYVYWWGAPDGELSWPGEPMILDENGIWGAYVPAGAEGILFHDGEGLQTADLELPDPDFNMFAVDLDAWQEYGWIDIEKQFYVAGCEELCDIAWTPDHWENIMHKTDDGTYVKVYAGVPAGCYELKVTDGTWINSWGANGGIENYVVTVEEEYSTVKIFFDPETKLISSTVTPVPQPGTQTYYLIGVINGEACGWEEDFENMGIYRFEDGQLTVNFTENSFVALKTQDNQRVLSYEYTYGSCTGIFSEAGTDLMCLPGDVELTLILEEYADGSVTLSYQLPSEADIVDAAYRLEEYEVLACEVALTGRVTCVNSPYDAYYENITVTIAVPGREDKPIVCYRLQGDGAETLSEGALIRVCGYLLNYRGTVEFEQGCYLIEVLEEGDSGPLPPEDPCAIVDAAYALAPGASLPWTVTLTGTVTEIQEPYSEDFRNITLEMVVAGRESMPIVCYRLRGEGTRYLQVGDEITVEGVIKNYAKTDYETGELLYTIVEFASAALVSAPDGEWITVYCRTGDDYGQCYVYWWYEDWTDLSWPGVPMEQDDRGIWYGQVPAHAMGLVFNHDGMGPQSYDLQVPTDNRVMYWMNIEQWVEYGYEPDIWLESFAIVGENLPGIDPWNPADPAGMMQEVSPYIFTKSLNIPAGTSIMFRFAGNGVWDASWNLGAYDALIGEEIPLSGAYAPNIELFFEEACVLQLTVDLNGIRSGGCATLLMEKVPLPGSDRTMNVLVPDTWPSVHVYSWEPDAFGVFPGMLMVMENGVYSAVIANDVTNLVFSQPAPDAVGWDCCEVYLEPNGLDVTVIIYPDNSYQCIYDEERDDTYRVVGNAAWMGSWEAAASEGIMDQITPDTYQKCFENVAPGNYEFMITRGGIWDDAISDRGNNFCFTVREKCDVTVTLTFVNGEPMVDVQCEQAMVGDVTGDGRLNLGDVSKLYAYIRGNSGSIRELAADFNGDGKINLGDAARLYAYVCGSGKTAVVDAAYRLEYNETMGYPESLTGKVISIEQDYTAERPYISLTLVVPGREDKPIACYRLVGNHINLVQVGDMVTVQGTLRNFYGTVEFAEGSILVKIHY